jgi:hypothetical protein
LSDTWQHFQGDRVLQVGLRWNSDRPIEDFSQESIELRLDQGRVSWALDPQLFWTSGSVEAPSAATRTVRIDSIYRDSETAQFKIGRVTGIGRALTVEVIDEAQLTGPIQVQFKLKYMSKGRRNWWTINWNQDVPASLVTRNGNRYTIAAGQIPIDDQLKKEGWIVAFEIQATHQLGSFRKTKQIDRYWHTIGTTTE